MYENKVIVVNLLECKSILFAKNIDLFKEACNSSLLARNLNFNAFIL
jgi:hypothetical protein